MLISFFLVEIFFTAIYLQALIKYYIWLAIKCVGAFVLHNYNNHLILIRTIYIWDFSFLSSSAFLEYE